MQSRAVWNRQQTLAFVSTPCQAEPASWGWHRCTSCWEADRRSSASQKECLDGWRHLLTRRRSGKSCCREKEIGDWRGGSPGLKGSAGRLKCRLTAISRWRRPEGSPLASRSWWQDEGTRPLLEVGGDEHPQGAAMSSPGCEGCEDSRRCIDGTLWRAGTWRCRCASSPTAFCWCRSPCWGHETIGRNRSSADTSSEDECRIRTCQ